MTRHQRESLLKFGRMSMGWERAAQFVGIGDPTWDVLVRLGYIEERREGRGRANRLLQLTDEGRKYIDNYYG